MKENRLKFSASVLKDCLENGGTDKKCAALAVLADPPGDGITDLSIAFQYDPSKWSFNAARSGFLCDFSVSGVCPATTAATGTFLLSDLPAVNFTPGAPLAGSTVSLANDPSRGVVTLNYSMSSPLNFNGDENFFLFSFTALTPPDATETNITFFDTLGSYDFTQGASSCSTVISRTLTSCGSDTPIEGFDLTSIPEPGQKAVLLAIFGGAYCLRRARKFRGSGSHLHASRRVSLFR